MVRNGSVPLGPPYADNLQASLSNTVSTRAIWPIGASLVDCGE